MTDKELFDLIDNLIGDRRLHKYGLKIENNMGHIEILGFIDTQDNFNAVKEHLKNVDFNPVVMEKIVPGDLSYAVVVIPTADMRKDPRFRSERVHQLIFGESLRTLGFENEYALVKDVRTNFIGYVNTSHLLFMDKDSIEKFKISGDKIIIDKKFSKVLFGDREMYVPFGSKIFARKKGNFWEGSLKSNRIKIPAGDASLYSEKTFGDIENVWPLFLGTPYLWGGASAYGYDCSGYVGRLYDYAGIKIPRDSDLQEKATTEVDEQSLSFGDLIFFPGHVGMYIGDGKMVHSNLTQGGVGISNILNPSCAYEEKLRKIVVKFGKVVDQCFT